jgi:hypothetical protein
LAQLALLVSLFEPLLLLPYLQERFKKRNKQRQLRQKRRLLLAPQRQLKQARLLHQKQRLKKMRRRRHQLRLLLRLQYV